MLKKTPSPSAVEGNICGPCKANALPPPCQGHGRKGAGKDDKKKAKTNPLTKDLNNLNRLDELLSFLLQSPLWAQVSPLEKVFIYTNPNALLKLKIDTENGVLTFRDNANLFKEEEKILQEFFKKIIDELDKFKKEYNITNKNFIATAKGNTLTVRLPNKELYDLFLERLMLNNLIATPTNLTPSQDFQQQKGESEKRKHFHPNPLDYSKGPRLIRWEDEK